jgi:murein DD-endopeptidase MepM/ murein hydrolase activator NlpD
MERIKDLGEASRALESTLVKQLLQSSRAFRGTQSAGSQLHAEMFMEVLADAVTKGDGLGIGRMLEKSLSKSDGDGAGDGGGPEKVLGAGLAPLRALPALHLEGLHGHQVTSGFGPREHPIDGQAHFHTGVDVRMSEGTPIRAAAGGVVRRAGERGGYGQAVEVDHGNGMSTLYAHASALAVQPGDVIQAGQALGWVGQTGNATGPHLHFEVRQQGKPIDPKRALNAYGIRAEETSEGSQDKVSKQP